MSSNDKKGKTMELFFDLTMNDDNDLLTLIKEEEKSALTSFDTTSKDATSNDTNNVGNDEITQNLNTNISIDLTNAENLNLADLDDLVKETEELIESISATVQESSKISAHSVADLENIVLPDEDKVEQIEVKLDSQENDLISTLENENTSIEEEINITPEQTRETFNQQPNIYPKVDETVLPSIEAKQNIQMELPKNKKEATVTETIVSLAEIPELKETLQEHQPSKDIEPEQDIAEELITETKIEETNETYIPHFISEELFQNHETANTNTDELVNFYDTLSNDNEKTSEVTESTISSNQILSQTGAFLFNTKEIDISEKVEEENQQEAQNISSVEQLSTNKVPSHQKQVEIKQSLNEAAIPFMSTIIEAVVKEETQSKVAEISATVIEDIPTEIEIEDTDQIETVMEATNKQELDIDILLKRLDEISEKEMLTSVAPKEKNEAQEIVETIEPEIELETESEERVAEVSLSPEEAAEEKMRNVVEQIIIPEINEIEEGASENSTDVQELLAKVTITEADTKLPELDKTGLEFNDEVINFAELPEIIFQNQENPQTEIENVANNQNVEVESEIVLDDILSNLDHLELLSKTETPNEEVIVDQQVIEVTPDVDNIVIAENAVTIAHEETNVESLFTENSLLKDTVTTLVNLPVVEETNEKKLADILDDINDQDIVTPNSSETNIEAKKEETVSETIETAPVQSRKDKKNSFNILLIVLIVILSIMLIALIYFLLRP